MIRSQVDGNWSRFCLSMEIDTCRSDHKSDKILRIIAFKLLRQRKISPFYSNKMVCKISKHTHCFCHDEKDNNNMGRSEMILLGFFLLLVCVGNFGKQVELNKE